MPKQPQEAATLPIDSSEPVKGFVNGLSPVQHVAIRYLAAGWSVEKVADEMKLPKAVVQRWLKSNFTFKAAYQQAVVAHTEIVEALLLVGEREAAATLIEALKANKSDKSPNWTVRVQAAMSLMDRAGERGRATEKQQVAQVTAHVKADGNAENALRKALRDPGVRAWLKETGQMPAVEAEVLAIEAPSAPFEPTIEVNFYTEESA